MTQSNASILSKFPEYGFRSTSVYNKRSSGRKWLMVLYVFLLVFGGIFAFGGIGSLVLYNILEEDLAGLTISILVGIFVVLSIPLLALGWYKKGILTNAFADYIQSKGRMRFFVKDGRFGLVQWKNFNILVPATYDKLMWVQNNEVMKATLDGEEFLIDIHNNKLS